MEYIVESQQTARVAIAFSSFDMSHNFYLCYAQKKQLCR